MVLISFNSFYSRERRPEFILTLCIYLIQEIELPLSSMVNSVLGLFERLIWLPKIFYAVS